MVGFRLKLGRVFELHSFLIPELALGHTAIVGYRMHAFILLREIGIWIHGLIFLLVVARHRVFVLDV